MQIFRCKVPSSAVAENEAALTDSYSVNIFKLDWESTNRRVTSVCHDTSVGPPVGPAAAASLSDRDVVIFDFMTLLVPVCGSLRLSSS